LRTRRRCYDDEFVKEFARRNELRLTKALSFTKAQIGRVIDAMRDKGIEPNAIGLNQDGSIVIARLEMPIVLTVAPPIQADTDWNFQA